MLIYDENITHEDDDVCILIITVARPRLGFSLINYPISRKPQRANKCTISAGYFHLRENKFLKYRFSFFAFLFVKLEMNDVPLKLTQFRALTADAF